MLQSRHAYNQGRRCESARNRICGTNAPATLPQLECQLISNRQVLAERSVGREGGREEVNRADATRGRRNLVRRTIGHRLPSATVFFQLLVIGVYLLRLLIANTARRCVTPPISLPPPFPHPHRIDRSSRVRVQEQRSKVFRIDRIHEIQSFEKKALKDKKDEKLEKLFER